MPSIRIATHKPVALDSPDYIKPWGTAKDNSRNLLFNLKLSWWIPGQLKVLDLGCSGGGFVKSIINQGDFAIGIEGSDYSKIRKRAEWATIPNYLFTADITEPFEILETDESDNEHLIKFNIITAWEVIEHIHPTKLANVFENILHHLMPEGIAIFSISTKEEVIDGLKLHQTVENRDWWLKKFTEFGFFTHDDVLSYFGDDWVRGGEREPDSFNIVLTLADKSLPYKERLNSLKILIQPLNYLTKIMRQAIKFMQNIIPEPIKKIYRSLRKSYKNNLQNV